MNATAALMAALDPMRDCHAGSALVIGGHTRGTSYQMPITFGRF